MEKKPSKNSPAGRRHPQSVLGFGGKCFNFGCTLPCTYPFAIFLFFCWRIPSWIPPYPPYPSIFLHFRRLFSSIFRPFFDLFFGSIFGRIFGRFLDDFGVNFGPIFRYGCILFRAFILLTFYSIRFRKYVNSRTPESRKNTVFPD